MLGNYETRLVVVRTGAVKKWTTFDFDGAANVRRKVIGNQTVIALIT